MLNQETTDKLKVLGFDVSKFSEAIKAEDEQSLDVPTLYTEDQKTSFGSNRFNEGKTAMSEILAKDIKKTYGIESESKDINEVVKLYGQQAIDKAGIKPGEWATEKESLQEKINSLISEKEQLSREYQSKLFGVEVKSTLSSIIPDNTMIGKDDITTLFLNTYGVSKDDEGRTVVKKGEEVLKDDLLNPKDLKTVVNAFLDERKLIKKDGMGGGDRDGGGSAKFKDMQQFMDYCAKNQIEPMGEEGQRILSEKKADDFKY